MTILGVLGTKRLRRQDVRERATPEPTHNTKPHHIISSYTLKRSPSPLQHRMEVHSVPGYPQPILSMLETAQMSDLDPDAKSHLARTCTNINSELRLKAEGKQIPAKLIIISGAQACINCGSGLGPRVCSSCGYGIGWITPRHALNVLSVYVPPQSRGIGRGR